MWRNNSIKTRKYHRIGFWHQLIMSQKKFEFDTFKPLQRHSRDMQYTKYYLVTSGLHSSSQWRQLAPYVQIKKSEKTAQSHTDSDKLLNVDCFLSDCETNIVFLVESCENVPGYSKLSVGCRSRGTCNANKLIRETLLSVQQKLSCRASYLSRANFDIHQAVKKLFPHKTMFIQLLWNEGHPGEWNLERPKVSNTYRNCKLGNIRVMKNLNVLVTCY